jgi:hypothetical protein
MNGDGKLDLVAFEKDGLLDNGLLPSAFRPHRLARVQVHLSLGTQLAAGVANYHELDCRGDRCLLVDVDGDDLPDVVEPFGSTIAGLGGDDLWVSLNNGITTNTLPGDIGSVGSGLCVPEPDEPSPLWKPISTFPVEEVAATSADLYALSSGGESVMRHTGGATWALSFASGLFAPVTGIGATEANVYMSRWGGILEQVSDGVWSSIGSMVSGSAWSKVVPGSSLLFATGGGYGGHLRLRLPLRLVERARRDPGLDRRGRLVDSRRQLRRLGRGRGVRGRGPVLRDPAAAVPP